MKAKCIKADPWGQLTVGTTYEVTCYRNVYVIVGTQTAFAKETFNYHFEEEKE